MRDRRVAHRYAEALLVAAKAEGVLADVNESYTAVLGAFQGRQDARIFLESPQVSTAEKKQLINDVLSGRIEPILVRFVNLLLDRNRLDYFRDIGAVFATLVERVQGFERAVVTTAVPLPADLAELLTAKLAQLTGSQIILKKNVDPGVIGGVSVTIGDKIVDGTVRTQLKIMREHLAKVSVR